jgi:hypothetical protein
MSSELNVLEYAVLRTVADCGDYWYCFDELSRLCERGTVAPSEDANTTLIRALRELMARGLVEAAPVERDRIMGHKQTNTPSAVDWAAFDGWTFRTAEDMIKRGRMSSPPYFFSVTTKGQATLHDTRYRSFDSMIDSGAP